MLAIAVVAAFAVAGGARAARRVIPWLDQRPMRASAHPQLAPACAAGALRAHLFLQGATGSLVGGVNLFNAGSRPCSLLGWPVVSLTGASALATPLQVRHTRRSAVPPDLLADPPGSLRALRSGRSASISLWWSNWCGSAPVAGSPVMPPAGLKLSFASGTSLVMPLAQAPRCDAPTLPSSLSVGPFVPATRRLPASSRLPLRAAIIGPRPVLVKPHLRAFRVHRGELLHYQIALTNTARRPFRFTGSSCPLYIEEVVPAPEQVYVLNCRPAKTITAGTTLVFEMQLHIRRNAPLGNTGLSWELAPKTSQPPFATAAVWVEP